MPFRRRFPSRRFLRRPFRRPGERQVVRALRKAHQHMGSSQYVQAAKIFERLADGATQRGLPQAPNLNFQAARARLEAGQVDPAIARARGGMQMLLAAGRYQQFALAEKRLLELLEAKGHKEQAERFRMELEAMKAGKAIPSIDAPVSKIHLPSKCPFCGGSILPDEVEWLDETTPGCGYCGSPLQSSS